MNNQTVLEKVNAELASRNLRQLPKLGRHTLGEIEITGIKEFLDYNKKFYTDVVFEVIFPGGATGTYPLRFNVDGGISDGAVMVPIINGKFAVVRMFRPALGDYFNEFPRGFGEALDNLPLKGTVGRLKIGDLPLRTVVRELGEEVVQEAVVKNITHLGSAPENSSTHATIVNFYLIQIEVGEDVLARRLKEITEEGQDLKLWSGEKLLSSIGVSLVDMHSLTAVLLYRNHARSLPAMVM